MVIERENEKTNKPIELIGIEKSNRKFKKFVAKFKIEGKIKLVHFGDNRYEDYTIHKDSKRRDNYLQRHKKNIEGYFITPGALSGFILWGPYPDIDKNIKNYRLKLAGFRPRASDL